MKNSRKKLIEWLFEHSQKLYTKLFKKHKPWCVTRRDLLKYPQNSFGYHLGNFLEEHNFELIAKVERHDAYHTLTGIDTKVEDEIALQCLCYGNGKRSLYLYGAVILGILILPDYLQYYKDAFKIGKSANAFHHYDYSKLLDIDFELFRASIFSKSQIQYLELTRT